jgi:hypothetical protein
MTARICSIASVVALTVLLAYAPPATGLSVDINCGGVKVGTLSVFDGFPLGAEFKATTTLADAAKQCGEHHFNWYQVVASDNKQPLDAGGKPVTAPYVDPPPGGYLDSNPATPGNQTLLADNLPWYWNEGPPPAGKEFEAGTTLGEHTDATTLGFDDVPGGASTDIVFKTWLVSLNADSSFHSFHTGFTWHFSSTAQNIPKVDNVAFLTGPPTDAEFKDITKSFATRVPEPGAMVTTLLGASALLGLGLRRRDASERSRPSSVPPCP